MGKIIGGVKTVLEVKRSDMNLVLVRHGETLANLSQRWSGSSDLEITDLTDRGKEQAIRLGRWFKERRFVPNYVYSSPQRRAFETAGLMGGHWGLNIEKIEDLKETDAGIFEGLNWSEIEERYPREAEGFQDSRDWSIVRGAEKESDRRSRAERLLKLAPMWDYSRRRDFITTCIRSEVSNPSVKFRKSHLMFY